MDIDNPVLVGFYHFLRDGNKISGKYNQIGKTLQQRIMEEAEWKILPKAIDYIANGKVKSSIPTMVKSIFFSFAKETILSNSIAPMGTHSAISPIPAFPGAQ